jgi:SAM-dependent methyltransferase
MMNSGYEQYVNDEAFLANYNEYQRRYADQIAERDKVLLGLLAENIVGTGTLLDIGCSTGNLLLHVKRAFPDLTLTGGELAESSLAEARSNPDLADIKFRTINMLNIEGQYDCITANAVTYLFRWPEYERAIQSIARALKPGGVFISFDWFHAFEGQDVAIIETTEGHPEGLPIHARSYGRVSQVFDKAGLGSIEFKPFFMPRDLPEPFDKSGTPITYTIRQVDGPRLSFRGCLYQPWCHIVSRKIVPVARPD